MSIEQVIKLPKVVLDYDYPVGIFDNFYIGPKKKGDLDGAEMFNHSCNPNAGVKGQIVLVARRNIKTGEEVCFDYETTDIKDLHFKCKCGSKKCREFINSDSWKDPVFQKKNRGYISWYILEKIKKYNELNKK